ncbi:MAG: aminodeoxychorismate/anthranilate synthase component II [Francisellaceae bacterium]|jgi:anthranilate synthase/aminodeoxychorismate synthase-like glutamine amidotransferase|nr:aminodeoxychorismate/anthranilate synthase component II [Francisellaceae bacterium]MBT6207975.1 aminodeoxychorismate/anthranilate synthase component II [Francisellaceae bacterium]MBT6539097.1 aminodeoxychorismate/anthranilate synthase component II [Francisellaceae bacterium]
MILLIDNYDSFVYNLLHYVNILGHQTSVYRNDKITLDEIEEIAPSHIILSPGPCSPNESGICIPLIKRFFKSIPILGVCLGHQAIGQAFNGKIIRAKSPIHGKKTTINCTSSKLYTGMNTEIEVARYHSLIVAKENFPNQSLKITSVCTDNQIMSLEHRIYPLFGVQFHPESILTKHGMHIIKNFITI